VLPFSVPLVSGIVQLKAVTPFFEVKNAIISSISALGLVLNDTLNFELRAFIPFAILCSYPSPNVVLKIIGVSSQVNPLSGTALVLPSSNVNPVAIIFRLVALHIFVVLLSLFELLLVCLFLKHLLFLHPY